MVHDLASLFKELRELFGEYNPKRALDLKTLMRSYPYMCHRRDDEPLDLERLKLLSRCL
jgi:hypothetical protein